MKQPTTYLLFVLALGGCGQVAGPMTQPQPRLIARLAFASDTFALKLSDSSRIRAIAYDASGMALPDAVVEYVATGVVSSTTSGTVTGTRPGVGILTARAGVASATTTVEVFGHPEGYVAGRKALSGRPFGVAITSAGIVYVTQLDAARVTRLDTATAIIHSIAVGQVPTAVSFAPDGATAYVTNQMDATVSVVDVSTAQQTGTIAIPANPFVPFVSPDGTRLFITSNRSQVYIVDPLGRQVTDSIQLTHAPNGFALHPDRSRVYVSTFIGGTVSEIHLATGAVQRTFRPGGTPQDMVVSPDGEMLFIANESGWIDVYDLGSGMPLNQVRLAGGGFGMALSPDQAQLYVTEPSTGIVEVVDIASRRVVHAVAVAGRPRRVAFTRHGNVAVIPNEAGFVTFVR